MAVLNDHKTVGAGFRNSGELHRVVYDFANDTGAVADYDVITADGSMLVELVNIDVKTAVTSGGALVMDLGKAAGGTEFKSDLAVASATLDAQIGADTAGTIVELADGEKIVLGLEVAAATAGKMEMLFRVYSR